jgi:molybdopterin converting factor small subunit
MVTVKVRYFQLSQTVKEKEEFFALGAGSRYSDLRRAIMARHPALTYIVTTALLEGLPATPDAELRDGVEVDLLASPIGG